jgi:hypothetical protein
MTNKEKAKIKLELEKENLKKKLEEDAIRHSLRVKASYSLSHTLNAQRLKHGRNPDLLNKNQINELLDLIIDKKWMTVIDKLNQYFFEVNK